MSYVSPFDPSRNAEVGEVVFYKHAEDGVVYPAIVCAVRLTREDGGMPISPATHIPADVRAEEGTDAVLTFQAHLTVFRPGKIEWRWVTEHNKPGGYTRKSS